MYLKVETEKCTGCRTCESFCSFHHERAIWPGRSRITILAESDEGPFTPNICRQCGALEWPEGETAPCAEACPVDAITLNDVLGAWVVDVDVCIGCGDCEQACPYGAIFVDEELGVSLKCDLCGGEPECAAMCPTGAVTVYA